MCKISVVIPVYKAEKTLERCVGSVLAQTFTDYEIILVDDGSPDRCGEICDAYAREHDCITVIHKENGGVADARNVGIDYAVTHSDSEWIAFIDSDDWIHPRCLEALLSAAETTGARLSACGHEKTAGEDPVVNESNLHPTIYESESFYCDHFADTVIVWGKLYQKSAFDRIRFPKGKIHEDVFVFHLLLFQYDRIAYIEEPLYAYYDNPGGIMSSAWHPGRMARFEAFSQQIEFFDKNGFTRAKKVAVSQYPIYCCIDIDAAKKNPEYVSEVKQLRRLLRRHLSRYKDQFPRSEKQYEWYYEYAYPKMYRLKKSIEVRLLRKQS